MHMVISVTKHLPGPSSCTLRGSLNIEAPRIFHIFPTGEDACRGGAPGVCTHYLLTWWSLGVERNRQGVGVGYLNFWIALELGVQGGLMYMPLNCQRPK